MALVEEARKSSKPRRCGQFGGAAEVPFADEGGGVAGGAEVVGHGFFADGEADAGRGVFRADGIKLETETRLVAPGEKAGARGGAERRGDVAVGETHAAGGERVEVRGGNFFAAVATEFAVAEIVGDDENDVRAWRGAGRGGVRGERCCEAEQRGEGRDQREEEAGTGRFHWAGVAVVRTPLSG